MLLGDVNNRKWEYLREGERNLLLGVSLYLRNNPGKTAVPLAEAVRYGGLHQQDVEGTLGFLKRSGRLKVRNDSGQEMLSLAGDALSPILAGESQPPLTERRHADLVLESSNPPAH